MSEVIIRQISPQQHPILHSQVLNLRNQLLRIPIGLDLFQEDLSQEANDVLFAATTKTTRPIRAKSIDSNPKEIGSEPDTTHNGDNAGQPETSTPQEKVIGCIMLSPSDQDAKTFNVRQMAVSPEFQGQGLGAKLVQSAEHYAKQAGRTRLLLNARNHAVGFYLKSGFIKKTEQEFIVLGIPHHSLEKLLWREKMEFRL